MAVIKGKSYTVLFYAWDTSNGAPKTGDAANITVRISKDGGTMSATTNSPSELDSTNAPGWYKVTLTDGEMNADSVLVVPMSTTTGVVCQQVLILTEKGRLDVNVGSRAAPGDAMTLTGGERGDVASAVWSATTRTLTGFGSLATDVANAVWSASTRTLTSFGTLANDVAQAVWAYTIEASQSALAWMRLVGAVLFNKRTYSGGNVTYRDWNDTKTRVAGTEDQDGNRTITSRDGS